MSFHVRPSSMPRAFSCPSSLAPTNAPINAHGDESDLGHAAHKALAQFVMASEPDLVAIAREHGVDVDDLEPLVAFGRKAWGDIGRYFPGVFTERLINSDLGKGTVDLLSLTHEPAADLHSTITVGDWKSGRNRREHRRQVQAYAEAARQSFGMPASGKITTIVVWLRFAEIEVMQFTAEDLDGFRRDFAALEPRIGKEYAPGEHCTGCRREYECEARAAFLRSGANALVAANQDGITPARLAELYPQAQMLEKALEAYRTALKLALVGGPLPIGNGKQIELVEAHRAIIDPRAARPVLEANGFTDEDIARTLTVSKGAIEAIAGERAPKGTKTRHQAAIINALESAGAVTLTSYTKLQQTKVSGG
jgi:hypothetical protein